MNNQPFKTLLQQRKFEIDLIANFSDDELFVLSRDDAMMIFGTIEGIRFNCVRKLHQPKPTCDIPKYEHFNSQMHPLWLYKKLTKQEPAQEPAQELAQEQDLEFAKQRAYPIFGNPNDLPPFRRPRPDHKPEY